MDPSDTEADLALHATAERVAAAYGTAMERHFLADALAAMMELVGAANGYAESQAPWSLNKAGEHERVGQVLVRLAEACRIVAHLLAPVAPTGSARILEQLGVPPSYDERGAGGPGLDALTTWGAGPGDWRTASPTPIFPRLEQEAPA
jgi:methionyl-tRNA synthetase